MAKDQSTVADEKKPDQDVKVEDAGPALKRLSIELPESRIKEKIESTYTQLRDDAVLPGFRRGRAPRRLLERRFSSTVSKDIKGQLIGDSYRQAIEDEGLDVIGEPDVKDFDEIEVPTKGAMKYIVEVEVAPTVELPAFDKIKITKQVREVTDADIDKEVNLYRERHGTPSVIEGGKAQEGDYLLADVKVLAGKDAGDDAQCVLDSPDIYVLVSGKSRDYKGHVAGIVVDDLGKLLKGKQEGDTESISITGPAGHEDEKIKGQPITLKLTIKKVERIELIAIDQLVEKLGLESEDDLKSRVREMLEDRNRSNQTADMYKQVSDYLVENVDLELPKGVTGRQTARVLQRQHMELAYRGVPEDEIAQQIAEMREGSEEEAIRKLKLFFILDKAAKDLDVQVNENEINGRIAALAMQQGRRPEKLRQEMHQRGQIEQLYLQLREQKVMDQVLEKADIEEVQAKDDTDAKPAATKKSPAKKTTKKKSAKKDG